MPQPKKSIVGLEALPQIFVVHPVASRARAWTIVIGMILMIALFDSVTGIRVSVAVFYLVPVSCATAWLGLGIGSAIAVSCTGREHRPTAVGNTKPASVNGSVDFSQQIRWPLKAG